MESSLLLPRYSPTDLFCLLPVAQCERGVIMAGSQPSGGPLPGIWSKAKPLVPLEAQLCEVAAQFITSDQRMGFELERRFIGRFDGKDVPQAILVIGKLATTVDALTQISWVSFPSLLRSLTGKGQRLPYLLAWQVLAGGLDLNVQAVEEPASSSPEPSV